MMKEELEAKLKTYRLSRSEYDMACKELGRPLEGIEWALFSALWSEHCSYKSSRVHLKNLYNKSKRVMQSFGENAGVIDLGDGERIAFKIESHNHPSFIEPYQGAATGVGGILRDIFTMGARPIALANYLCFGEPTAPRMQALVDGVVRGIGGYGNCVGVPTITGQTEFHSSYNQNILVNAMAVGLFLPGEEIHLSQARGVGNWIVYVGAKTGRDGVHGASMASESFGENTQAKKPTVQIGDPFFEKLLIESCLEVMQKRLVVAIQDMGAAGLTSSSFEMASKGGVGFAIDLDHVPLRDSTMTPEDILLSESQERMLLVCEPKQFAEIQKEFSRWGLDAAKIGIVTEKKEVVLNWHGKPLTTIDPDILVENAPRYQRPYSPWVEKNRVAERKGLVLDVKDAKAELLGILNHVRGTNRNWIYEQYDQRVGAQTVRDSQSPFGVLRLPHSGRGLGVILGCRPHVMRFDAEIGGMDSVAYPALEMASQGFESLALSDCLNFANPEKPEVMSEFVAALSGMNLICEKSDIPIISGNVSFYNETQGQGITPTPTTGLVGMRPSIDKIPQTHFTKPGQIIYVLRIPGLLLTGALADSKGAKPQGFGKIKPEELAQFIHVTRRVCSHSAVDASRVVGKFGLAYTLARMSLTGVGAKIEGNRLKTLRPTLQPQDLFLEHLYEVVLQVYEGLEIEFIEAYNRELNVIKDLELQKIGVTMADRLEVENLLSVSCQELTAAYNGGWSEVFHGL